MNFGEQVRQARQRLGLSQRDLAKRAGMNPSHISHIETGKRNPSITNASKLQSALAQEIGENAVPFVPTEEISVLAAYQALSINQRDIVYRLMLELGDTDG